jgi:hypothetical protein
MKETPRLYLNSLVVCTYDIAGNCANDTIRKVWNATMNHVSTSTVSELLTENTCLVEQARDSHIT